MMMLANVLSNKIAKTTISGALAAAALAITWRSEHTDAEIFTEVLLRKGVRIKHIVSNGRQRINRFVGNMTNGS
jgi:hypothetical protein